MAIDPCKGIGLSLSYLILVAVLPLLLFSAGVAWLIVDQKKAAVGEQLGSTARALLVAVDRELSNNFAAMSVLATDPELESAHFSHFRERARQVVQEHGTWVNVGLIDPRSYRIVAAWPSAPTPAPETFSKSAIDDVVRTGKPLIVGAVQSSPITKGPVILLLSPVSRGGEVRYVLGLALNPRELSSVFAEQQLPPSWTGAVLDGNLNIVGRSRDLDRYFAARATPSLAERIAARDDGMFMSLTQDGASVYSVFSRSPGSGWSVVIGIPAPEVEEPVRRVLLALAATGSGLTLVALALTGLLGFGIVRRRNAYEDALREAKSRLRDSLEEFDDLITRIPTGIFKLRMFKEGGVRFDFVSERWCEQLSLTAEEAYKDPGAAYRRVHPDDLHDFLEMQDSARKSLQPFVWEGRIATHSSEVWLHIEASPAELPNGDILWNGIQYDITQRRMAEIELEHYRDHLEGTVASRTAELVAANRELESFTFAASHDLRGPLGRINSFSTLLEQQYRDRLEGNGLLYLEFIRQNAIRLTQLVDDLLHHARTAHRELDLKPVDVLTRVLVVLEESAEEIRNSGADVRIAVPPVRVLADPQVLTQALSNVIRNALKYSAAAKPPVIDIGGEERGGALLLWVRDNGIGFDMAYHDRIFKIFNRLHTYDEYEGSGIGLALVKRAMERMGGRVWAESAPGRGSTFFLELQLERAESPATA